MKARGIVPDDVEAHDPPDFVVKLGDQRIAVEVLEYFEPHLPGTSFTKKQVEEAWQDLRACVREVRDQTDPVRGLSVSLEFKTQVLPNRRDFPKFVEAVIEEIQSRRSQINDDFVYLKIDDRTPVLGTYLKNIRVRDVGIYMEWDWNYDMGAVGATEDDLLAATERKLTEYRPAEGATDHHLVIAGWNGPGLASIIAPMSSEQFAAYTRLNERLERGPFDAVAVLCFKNLLWERGAGWSELPRA